MTLLLAGRKEMTQTGYPWETQKQVIATISNHADRPMYDRFLRQCSGPHSMATSQTTPIVYPNPVHPLPSGTAIAHEATRAPLNLQYSLGQPISYPLDFSDPAIAETAQSHCQVNSGIWPIDAMLAQLPIDYFGPYAS
ncbi:unnamed protein product, partial [Protopolystoma xenopodis]